MTRRTSYSSHRRNCPSADSAAFPSLLILVIAILFVSGCAGIAADKTPPSAPQISVTPNSIEFQNVVVGQKNTQSIQISNSGNANLEVTAVTLTGPGFSLGSIAAPLQLAPGTNKSFTVSFAPTAVTTSAKATIAIASNDATSPLSVSVAGSAVKANPAWQMTPASLAFPSLSVQASQSQNATLHNTGNVPVTISSISVTGSAFSISGLANGMTLSPSQQVPFQITFHPTAAGATSGTLKVVSASASSALSMSLSGSATTSNTPPPTSHTVHLSWGASPTATGYRVYRGTISGGPYNQINSSLVSQTMYADSAVSSGKEYFYVTTAVNAAGEESGFSNEASATIPNP